jgi:hypothetical protein
MKYKIHQLIHISMHIPMVKSNLDVNADNVIDAEHYIELYDEYQLIDINVRLYVKFSLFTPSFPFVSFPIVSVISMVTFANY